jgi:hypothetical protein
MPRICSAVAFPMLQQPEFKNVPGGVRACFADSGHNTVPRDGLL